MTHRLKGRVAIVTGAASGIGAEIATRLAREGAQTVVAAIDLGGASDVVASIALAGDVAAACTVGMGDEQSIVAMIDFAVRTFGGLDILDNNAADTALSSTRDVGVEHTETEVWDALMRINLRGTMLACKAVIPRMRSRGGGSIINISSACAQRCGHRAHNRRLAGGTSSCHHRDGRYRP